jgi:hypothetical protein
MKTYRIYLDNTVVDEIKCENINEALERMDECYKANPQLPKFSLTVSEYVGAFTLPRE